AMDGAELDQLGAADDVRDHQASDEDAAQREEDPLRESLIHSARSIRHWGVPEVLGAPDPLNFHLEGAVVGRAVHRWFRWTVLPVAMSAVSIRADHTRPALSEARAQGDSNDGNSH